MPTTASQVSLHLAGEEKDEIVLATLTGRMPLTRTDEALTAYGGLAAWSGFLQHLGIIERPWLNRGDLGFGQEAIMAWHETEGEKRPKYLFKRKLTSHVRRAIAKVPWPLWEGANTVGCQQLAETTVKLQGWSRARRIVILRTLKPTNPTPQSLFWDTPEDEVAVSVTHLESGDATLEQVALLYAQRADTANVFDEWKHQWGRRGDCSKRAVVTELAARLVLLTYNLWSLFNRLMGLNPGHHTEAIKSRRNFLFMAAQVVESGRQRTLKLAVKAEWWQVLKGCYEPLRTWLAATAPPLEAQGSFLRLLSRQTTNDPLEWLAQPAPTPTG